MNISNIFEENMGGLKSSWMDASSPPQMNRGGYFDDADKLAASLESPDGLFERHEEILSQFGEEDSLTPFELFSDPTPESHLDEEKSEETPAPQAIESAPSEPEHSSQSLEGPTTVERRPRPQGRPRRRMVEDPDELCQRLSAFVNEEMAKVLADSRNLSSVRERCDTVRTRLVRITKKLVNKALTFTSVKGQYKTKDVATYKAAYEKAVGLLTAVFSRCELPAPSLTLEHWTSLWMPE